MKVEKGRKVTINYEIAVEGGEVLESSEKHGPLEYIHGDGRMLPGLEARIEGLGVGDTAVGVLQPSDAFASIQLPTQVVLRSEFPEGCQIDEGQHFEALNSDGDKIRFEIIQIKSDEIEVRYEHPLAHESIRYQVEILDVVEVQEEGAREAIAGIAEQDEDAVTEEPEAQAPSGESEAEAPSGESETEAPSGESRGEA